MEGAEWKDDLQGTPQDEVVSPILANVYLHYVLDFKCVWLKTLRRRSQRTRITLTDVMRLAAQYWPPVRVRHPWPDTRFAVHHPR